METHTYLVTLQPLEPWFFGGEKLAELGNRTNFHQKSTLYPQQTALLGLLRHQVLIHHDLIDQNGCLKDDATDYIGETGFDAQNRKGYGRIVSLGPVHLRLDGQPYFAAPADVDWLWEERQDGKVHYGDNRTLQSALFTPQYSAKGSAPALLSDPNGKTVPLEEVVQWMAQPGITKKKPDTSDSQAKNGPMSERSASKKPDERDSQGYYRQEYIWPTTTRSFAFGFYAELKGEWPEGPQTVLFGGQRSPFNIHYNCCTEVAPPSLVHQYTLPTGWHRIVLLSPAYTPTDFARMADFAVNRTLSMRHIQTSVKQTKHYSGLKRHASEDARIDTPTLSDRLTLQDRGSVFYFSSEDACKRAIAALEAQTAFRTIGYNQYIKA